MSATQQDIKSQQEATWNKLSGGWKKWDNKHSSFTGVVSKALVNAINFKLTDYVLDIGSGTGEPGISIAQNKVPQGKVELTDIAMHMLEVAKGFATEKGVNNIGIHQCAADSLPFADNTFDAVTGRFAFMFFPDIPATMQEIKRVMKPGARLSTAVWAEASKNVFATLPLSVISQHAAMPAPAPGAPGIFRCGMPGYLEGLFGEQGFTNVTEEEISFAFTSEDIDTYWHFITELLAPVVAALALADDDAKARIKQQVYDACGQYMQDGQLSLPASAFIITAEK